MKIERIETARLYLRGFTPADAMFAIGIWNSPDTCEFLTDEPMETIDPAYLKMVEGLGDEPECCYLIAEDKATGERVGTCSFIPKEDVYDIAYCVARKHQRKGYATEMAQGMKDYAKSHGGKRLTILIFKGNDASIAVAKKLGCHAASERPYQKKGSAQTLTEYLFETEL